MSKIYEPIAAPATRVCKPPPRIEAESSRFAYTFGDYYSDTVVKPTPEEELKRYAEALQRAQQLLQPGESSVPHAVQQVIHRANALGIRYELSRNEEANSCKDAAGKRVHRGKTGIHLWNELKSILCETEFGKQRKFAVIHYRGDCLLDKALLIGNLGSVTAGIKRLAEAEELGLGYGLINPFLLPDNITHVFDKELLERMGDPGMVMTNAGDRTWAIAFFADELALKLEQISSKEKIRKQFPNISVKDVFIEKIAVPNPNEMPLFPGLRNMRRIGVLYGNSPDSGTLFLRLINAHIRALIGESNENNMGDFSQPEMKSHSVRAQGLSMELDVWHQEVWQVMELHIRELCEAGCRILAIADNTTQYFAKQIQAICDEYGAEFVLIADCVAEYLKNNGISKIALVGIRFVSDLDGGWSAYREPLAGIEVERLSEYTQTRIQKLAHQIKEEGPTEKGINGLRDVLNQEISSDVVVLALTELSEVFQKQKQSGKSGKLVIDPLKLYAEEVARKFLGI